METEKGTFEKINEHLWWSLELHISKNFGERCDKTRKSNKTVFFFIAFHFYFFLLLDKLLSSFIRD